MLKLFQTGSIGRVWYLSILAFIVAFDFVKDPLSDALARTSGQLQQQVYQADGPALGASHDAMLTELRGTADIEAARETMNGIVAGAVAMEAKASAIGAVYVAVVAAIGFASLAVLIWMVFARVRDIAWPAAVGFAILAPALAMRLFGAQMPDILWMLLQYGFIGALIILGLVPTGFGSDAQPVPEAASARKRAGAAPGGGFGRRGTSG